MRSSEVNDSRMEVIGGRRAEVRAAENLRHHPGNVGRVVRDCLLSFVDM